VNDPLALLPRTLFAGERVFVTGGGSGIGLAIARAFGRLGAVVALCGRSLERLAAAVAQLQGEGLPAIGVPCDVRDAEALREALGTVRDQHGPIRHLVCAAAGNFVAPAERMSPKGFRTVVDIDLLGSFNAVHAAHPQLLATRGTVLFVSGGQSFVPFKFQAHVGAAKAGIDQLMRSLALEWAGQGIRVNSLVPGPIAGTEGMRRLSPPGEPDFWTRLVPMGRLGQPEEVARMAVVLASPLASFVTGALLPVDGGQNLTGSAPFNDAVERLLPTAE
jgi:NAD(P)-dependent dehydrogenase (short-subunit alcohol dehydrogenase family)